MMWLVSWAADVLCTCKVQSFGMTGYEYATGLTGIQPIVVFFREGHVQVRRRRGPLQVDAKQMGPRLLQGHQLEDLRVSDREEKRDLLMRNHPQIA